MPRPHPPEFGQRAVGLARLREKPLKLIAANLGISESCLRAWVARADVEDGRRPGVTKEEHEELIALRRELRVAKMENEILKRASGFFAQENVLPLPSSDGRSIRRAASTRSRWTSSTSRNVAGVRPAGRGTARTAERGRLLSAVGVRSSGPSSLVVEMRVCAVDRLAYNFFNVIDVDAESFADVHRPDLRTQVGFEVKIAADIRASPLSVLRDHNEGCENADRRVSATVVEDRFQADDHRQQAERELVELAIGTEYADIERDPYAEPRRMDVHESEGSREGSDSVADPVLSAQQPV
jgi:transposase